jgi:hypothetical protein
LANALLSFAINIGKSPFLVEGAECIANAFETVGEFVLNLLGGPLFRRSK